MGRVANDMWVNFLAPILVGFLAGACGSMGLGGGSVLIIYLTVFAGVRQLSAQGINLIFFLPTAALAVLIYSKKGIIKWKYILPIMLFGVVGTVFSSFLVGFLKAKLIKKLFGAVIVFYGVYELIFSKREKAKVKK